MQNKIKLKKVLIVDDDILSQFLCKKTVKDISDEVLSFGNGLEALNYLKITSEMPNLIILDLEMPVMDGWTFLKNFNDFEEDLRKDIKIAVVTSNFSEKVQEKSIIYKDIALFFEKPLEYSTVETVLGY